MILCIEIEMCVRILKGGRKLLFFLVMFELISRFVLLNSAYPGSNTLCERVAYVREHVRVTIENKFNLQ